MHKYKLQHSMQDFFVITGNKIIVSFDSHSKHSQVILYRHSTAKRWAWFCKRCFYIFDQFTSVTNFFLK